ncbi:putative prenyl cysteine carboxyl methyltransferase ste14 [Venturia nashicola]|uniref:Protein-S-isoprenylcysteine O-methyltransferase n=1 Tax=Venturia nashicola TaxID=86259 RepID=A0A4Z1NUU1_9PEZI|nr:putative prenyl cysteine carboxyl methyltransferase ste14 [Venturia nashicola]TLD21036.1 putative prenyl cysteine carboxyl methyltransferase ste14 [Venturia nashicola]
MSQSRPDISWPLERPSTTPAPDDTRLEAELRNRANAAPSPSPSPEAPAISIPSEDLLPGHKRSQSGISLRAFLLGQTLAFSLLTAYYARFERDSRLWRPPLFLSILSLFHFLEFWTTARYNLPNANVSAFLLFDNGLAYQIAHATAMVEATITSICFPGWQARFSPAWVRGLGLGLIIVGQLFRSLAMVTAGTNFNHQVQRKRAIGHQLVTTGVYGVLRHPSYFGFFWWAIGTQLLVGNPFCLVAYVLVLWRFFSRRIQGEELYLVGFFGDEYVQFRKSTRVGIPFIR